MVRRWGTVKRGPSTEDAPTLPTDNSILGGRVRLRQAADGYRAGLDAALLAAACDASPGQRVLDAGCGAGAVMLAAACRTGATFVGIEKDPVALDLAAQNIELNELGHRLRALAGDIGEPFARLGLAPFDAVLANPPFFDDPAALRSPSEARRGAWLAPEGLGGWTGFLLKAVRQGGSITLIHRADRLGELLAALTPKAGSFQIRPVHPFAEVPAKRVLIRARKSGRAPLRLLPPLILHERGGPKHTERTEAILRGEADLAWN